MSVKIGPNLVNMKEFISLFIYFYFINFLYFELFITLYCVLGLKEMSVSLTDNVLKENYQDIFLFSTYFIIIIIITVHFSLCFTLHYWKWDSAAQWASWWWNMLICHENVFNVISYCNISPLKVSKLNPSAVLFT